MVQLNLEGKEWIKNIKSPPTKRGFLFPVLNKLIGVFIIDELTRKHTKD
jgi:hypothetical protein